MVCNLFCMSRGFHKVYDDHHIFRNMLKNGGEKTGQIRALLEKFRSNCFGQELDVNFYQMSSFHVVVP